MDKEFGNAGGPHKAPITLVEFSEKGGRLVSCDTVGICVINMWQQCLSVAFSFMLLTRVQNYQLAALPVTLTGTEPHPDSLRDT